MTAMSERILEARALVKKIRTTVKSRLRRRRLRNAEGRLASLRADLERGALEVTAATRVGVESHLNYEYSYNSILWFNTSTSIILCKNGKSRLWTPRVPNTSPHCNSARSFVGAAQGLAPTANSSDRGGMTTRNGRCVCYL